MLDLTKRVDLMALSDAQLADPLQKAEMADDNHRKIWVVVSSLPPFLVTACTRGGPQ
jgi:hypothetical protein